MSLLLQRLLSRRFRNEESGEGDGAASAPASSSSADEGGGVDWEGMNEGIAPGVDDIDEGSESSPVSSTNGVKPEAALPNSPTSDDPDEVTPPDEPDPDEPVEGEGNPPEEEVAPVLTPEQQAAERERLNQEFNAWEASQVERLAETEYALDEETAQRLQTEPELVLPRLAAQLELKATRRALEAVQRMLPDVLPTIVQKTTVEKQAEDAFYTKHPDLKPYKKQVLQMGQMFRRMNPNATPDEAIEKIGAMVRAATGVKPVAASGKPAAATRTAPHRPAAAGGRGSSGNPAPAAKPQGDVDWGDLANDD